MRIGYLFENYSLGQIDCSKPYLGNPGFGGKQFCILNLMYYINEYNEDFHQNVYCYEQTVLPGGCNCIVVDDIYSCLDNSKKNNDDLLIICQFADNNRMIYDYFTKSNLNIVLWAHNYLYGKTAKLISDCVGIKRVVFVGREQYDYYVDDDIISKSTYIYNMINDYYPSISRNNDSKTVVYAGALIPSKGFHILARIWKTVVKECPNAILKVIGSGELYSRDNVIGKYGLAEKRYEEQFMKYLVNDDGNILPSVEFLGILGREKNKIFMNSSVGVVNPCRWSRETFGLIVAEMACLKLPTVNRNRYYDVLIDGNTGYLCGTSKGLVRKIVYLLNNKKKNDELGNNAKEFIRKFSPKNIIPQWIDLFLEIQENKNPKYYPPSAHYFSYFKFLRIINRFIRFKIGMKFIPSIVQAEFRLFMQVKKIIK